MRTTVNYDNANWERGIKETHPKIGRSDMAKDALARSGISGPAVTKKTRKYAAEVAAKVNDRVKALWSKKKTTKRTPFKERSCYGERQRCSGRG